jgi:2-keto-3-deoxy-6-phosphogluconate aldolase
MAPAGTLIGAGTVMSPQDVQAVAEAGGRLIVCPHCDPAVIDEAVALGLWCVPGVGTASEAFTALRHGAHGLKLFPAEVWGPRGLKALKAVLPEGTPLWPVGGVAAVAVVAIASDVSVAASRRTAFQARPRSGPSGEPDGVAGSVAAVIPALERKGRPGVTGRPAARLRTPSEGAAGEKSPRCLESRPYACPNRP